MLPVSGDGTDSQLFQGIWPGEKTSKVSTPYDLVVAASAAFVWVSWPGVGGVCNDWPDKQGGLLVPLNVSVRNNIVGNLTGSAVYLGRPGMGDAYRQRHGNTIEQNVMRSVKHSIVFSGSIYGTIRVRGIRVKGRIVVKGFGYSGLIAWCLFAHHLYRRTTTSPDSVASFTRSQGRLTSVLSRVSKATRSMSGMAKGLVSLSLVSVRRED